MRVVAVHAVAASCLSWIWRALPETLPAAHNPHLSVPDGRCGAMWFVATDTEMSVASSYILRELWLVGGALVVVNGAHFILEHRARHPCPAPAPALHVLTFARASCACADPPLPSPFQGFDPRLRASLDVRRCAFTL